MEKTLEANALKGILHRRYSKGQVLHSVLTGGRTCNAKRSFEGIWGLHVPRDPAGMCRVKGFLRGSWGLSE